MSPRPRLHPGLALAAGLLVAACDGEHSSYEFSSTHAESVTTLPAFPGALEVLHEGTRLVEVWDRDESPARYLAYEEELVSDGAGEFSLVPTVARTAVAPDWYSFQVFQRSRARFLVRYRDFAVRDRVLFLRAWSLRDAGRTEVVAGRACSVFEVQRLDGQRSYEIARDDLTGLVLRAEERDADGLVVGRLTYLSFDPTPDLASVAFYRSSIDETVEEGVTTSELDEVFGQEVLAPRILPEGYALAEVSTLVDDQGTSWAKLTYLDGVQPLFFAQVLTPDGSTPSRGRKADSILVSREGEVSTASGRVAGRRVLVVGKLAEDEVLDLVESALP